MQNINLKQIFNLCHASQNVDNTFCLFYSYVVKI